MEVLIYFWSMNYTQIGIEQKIWELPLEVIVDRSLNQNQEKESHYDNFLVNRQFSASLCCKYYWVEMVITDLCDYLCFRPEEGRGYASFTG